MPLLSKWLALASWLTLFEVSKVCNAPNTYQMPNLLLLLMETTKEETGMGYTVTAMIHSTQYPGQCSIFNPTWLRKMFDYA